MAGTYYEYIEDHESAAQARQIETFKNKANFQKLITIFSEAIQTQEDTLKQFRDERFLATAYGVQLDFLGEYFLVERGTDSDDLYRSRIQTAIHETTNAGQVNPLIDGYRALIGSDVVILKQYFPATVILTAIVDSLTIPNQDVIRTAMRRIKAAGVEIDLGASLSSDQAFTMGSAPGQIDSNIGLSSNVSGTDGGRFATRLD